MQSIIRHRDLILPISIIGCLVVILIPLPTAVLDLLLAANITVGVLILLTTIHVASPIEFSVFPTLLLATTLARLVLNVATTRLILTGSEKGGLSSAGNMIESFGTFVAGDQVEVGLIIFIILVVIQFVVVTKGATRISEVAARFALDGMPGRQMAIDSDLNAGIIDEATARKRREELSDQADFYGTMDGASKFVRGDAIAAIIITVVNILGGFYVGVVHHGMSITASAGLYTKLTIGDGLVSQIPALLISLGAGFLVTRSSKPTNLPVQFLQQLFSHTRVLAVAGGFLLLLVLTNLPAIPVATLGTGCVGLAFLIEKQNDHRRKDEQARTAAAEAEANAIKPPRVEDFLAVDPMEISIGVGLLELADPAVGGDLMDRITSVRQSLASDLGFILPKVRVRDDRNLGEFEYVIRIHGNIVSRNQLRVSSLLASETDALTGHVEGEVDEGWGFGVQSKWIDPALREKAAVFGYTIREPVAVLSGHLERTAKLHADELLSRDATKHLIDEIRGVSPLVVDELIPDLMRVSQLQQILHRLLKEDVPIRQMSLILETLSDALAHTEDPEQLVEVVRQRLARTISSRYRDQNGVIHVMTLDPQKERVIADGFEFTEQGTIINCTPSQVEDFCMAIRTSLSDSFPDGMLPILLVNPRIRSGLQLMVTSLLPELRVLSYEEISDETQIESHGLIGDSKAAIAA